MGQLVQGETQTVAWGLEGGVGGESCSLPGCYYPQYSGKMKQLCLATFLLALQQGEKSALHGGMNKAEAIRGLFKVQVGRVTPRSYAINTQKLSFHPIINVMKAGFTASYRSRLEKQTVNDGQGKMTYFLASLSRSKTLTISLCPIGWNMQPYQPWRYSDQIFACVVPNAGFWSSIFFGLG